MYEKHLYLYVYVYQIFIIRSVFLNVLQRKWSGREAVKYITVLIVFDIFYEDICEQYILSTTKHQDWKFGNCISKT